jgi:hypothetical protein
MELWSLSFNFLYTEAVIGFVPDNYTVTEGTDLFASLNVELISGQLGRDVIVSFDTQDGSAQGLIVLKSVYQYHVLTLFLLIFI